MTNRAVLPWESKRTDETRRIEDHLKQAGFRQVDAYRYNVASIRIRVIDPRFEGLAPELRDAMVEPFLDQLPEKTQVDVTSLFTFAPLEIEQTPKTFREFLQNMEFDHPSPSML